MLFDEDILEHVRLVAREGDRSGEDRDLLEILFIPFPGFGCRASPRSTS